MIEKPLCIFHKNCLDGVGAAWVANRFFDGEVDLVPGEYGKPVDLGLFKDRDVYFADFCYKRQDMLDIKTIAKSLVVLDHHETAHKEVGDLFNINQKRSGVMLAWDHFFPNEVPPKQLLLIEDRDLWVWKFPETEGFTAYAFSQGVTLETLDYLIHDISLERACKLGDLLVERENNALEDLVKNKRYMVMMGHKIPVVNAGGEYASKLGSMLSKGEPFSASYQDLVKGRKFSLRSKKEGVDVNVVAESYGGGGHTEAAGFFISYDDPKFPTSHLFLD